MKKIIFIDPETFEPIEQQFGDFHYNLAENIQKFLAEKYQCTEKFGDCSGKDRITNIVSTKGAKSLMVGIMRDRKNGETIAEKYRIIIEKNKRGANVVLFVILI